MGSDIRLFAINVGAVAIDITLSSVAEGARLRVFVSFPAFGWLARKLGLPGAPKP